MEWLRVSLRAAPGPLEYRRRNGIVFGTPIINIHRDTES